MAESAKNPKASFVPGVGLQAEWTTKELMCEIVKRGWADKATACVIVFCDEKSAGAYFAGSTWDQAALIEKARRDLDRRILP